jgi:hypothetical protein
VIFPFIVNLGIAFYIIIDELTRSDLTKLLTKVRILYKENAPKESENASNQSEKVRYLDHTKDMNIEVVSEPDSTIRSREANKNKLNELIEITIELKKIEELEDVSKLTKKLKEVNEQIVIDQLVNYIKERGMPENEMEDIPEEEVKNIQVKCITEIEVISIINELKGVNEIIKEITQFEDFVQEFEKLKELRKETIKLKEVTEFINDPENLEEYTKLNNELEKVNELSEELKKINEYTEKLKINEYTGDDDLIVRLVEELKNVKMFIDKLNKVDKATHDNVNVTEDKTSNFDENKGRISRIINMIKKLFKVEREEEKNDHSTKQEKGYQKFSKWLKNHRDNKTLTVLFIILAGIDVENLKLLDSRMRIRIPSYYYFEFRIKRTRGFNVYFNAKLSRTTERKLLLGMSINYIIKVIYLILLIVCNFSFINFFLSLLNQTLIFICFLIESLYESSCITWLHTCI